MSRVEKAIDRAYAWALHLPTAAPKSLPPRPRRFAIGDPQASLERFLGILDRNGLLGDDGTLAPDVTLVSIGDHFDWGKASDVVKATDDALALLAWLAHHESDRVVLIAGNHDLARVGELSSFDDATFVRVREEAHVAYRKGNVDRDAERAFLSRYPMLPTAEVAARDFSAFREQQRRLVEHLLRQGRFQLAWAPDDTHLFLHAGVTQPILDAIGAKGDARAIARALNDRLAQAVDAWKLPDPLHIPHIHRPGDAEHGEGGGMLYHRAADSKYGDRRFDPRTLPRGIVQVIGHVRDEKCRKLLGTWCKEEPSGDGAVRHLATNGDRVSYARGLPEIDRDEANVVFIDNGMNYVGDLDQYEIVEIMDGDRLRPRAPSRERSA